MRKMSVREIRLHWPKAEKALATEGEIVVTRDSEPVARILPYSPLNRRKPRRFDAKAHLAWLRKFSKGTPRQASTGELLREDREDRD